MIDTLIEPLQHGFMLRAFAAAVLVGLVCGVVGCFIVLRGMAFYGSALSHAILPGVGVGYLLGGAGRGGLFCWALATAVGIAFGIGWINRNTRFREDTTIGIIFAGMFALGIALISSAGGYSVDLVHLLFGNVLSVGPLDLALTAGFGALVLVLLFLFYKELVVLSFDETLAFTLRLPHRFIYYLLLVLMAVTIVVSLQTVGIALVLAMLVTPPATAYLLTRRLPVMMALSAVIGMLSGAGGLYVSYYTGVAAGPAIVLVTMVFFIAALIFSPNRGRFARRGGG